MTSTSVSNYAWTHPSFWTTKCPSLTISEPTIPTDTPTTHINTTEQISNLHQQGYALLPTVSIPPTLLTQLSSALQTLHSYNIPPPFLLLFNETWHLLQTLSSILLQLSHPSHVLTYDIVPLLIEHTHQGFSPHRDRHPWDHDPSPEFHSNGDAKYLTLWYSLTDATCESSCLYVLPKDHDAGYDMDTKEDILEIFQHPKEMLPNVRALPRSRGESIVFTQRLLHWGSRSNGTRRMSVSVTSSDPNYEASYLKWTSKKGEIPPFETRLALACAQCILYRQRYEGVVVTHGCLTKLYRVCKNHDALEERYTKNVAVEYIKGVKESCMQGDVSENGWWNDVLEEKDGVVEEGMMEDEELLLEEMLIAEMEGNGGDFMDDYDGLTDNDQEDDIDSMEHTNEDYSVDSQIDMETMGERIGLNEEEVRELMKGPGPTSTKKARR